MFRLSRVPLTFAVVLLAAACSNDTPTAPSTPTPKTEEFSGTVNHNGAVVHPFATTLSGEIRATLTSLTPSTARVTLAIGSWSSSAQSCTQSVTNDSATQGTLVLGQITTVGGTFCIRVSDPNGILTDPVPYTVQVVHPQ